MTLLHVYFALRNQQAFQRLLDTANGRKQPGGSTSNSGGRSWSKNTSSTLASAAEVNARDSLGRTVLHLACNAPDSLEYVRLLLRNPAVDVNIQDQESRWTPLHRALYHGNIAAAMLLLERSETDVSIKDLEGYTAFELYNSTVQGTTPNDSNRAELFTWGHNRNAALGLGDANDRAHPEQVFIPQPDTSHASSIYARFQPLPVQRVCSAKLHTVVITSEKEANLRVCGFASGGRLGPGQHTQYGLTPIAGLSQTIVSVALGQDHTLALTDSGEVLSWGLNRFSQLGYTVETTSGKLEEPVQPSPKKIIALKKEFVRGVAACRTASVCWTSTQVFAWGTSNGQLGFDKNQPTPVPRIVSKITRPVLQICLTESALVCLLDSQDVVCLWSGRIIKINFPAHGFPHAMQPYRPPQAARGGHTVKITSCDETIAALSSDGQVFAFSIPPPAITEPAASTTHKTFQPYTVWTPRMQHMSARDAAVGNNGTVVICTKSGHIFMPSKKGGIAGKALKYQVVPHLQRVVGICANSTGAFGALRVDFDPPSIVLTGQTLAQDLANVLPFLRSTDTDSDHHEAVHDTRTLGEEDDDDGGDLHILDDANRLNRLRSAYSVKRTTLEAWRDDRDKRLPHGADMSVLVQQNGHVLPVHQVILSARSTVLAALLRDGKEVRDDFTSITISSSSVDGRNRLTVQRAHPMAVLLLLDYLYSDHILAIWDHRLSLVGVDSAKVKSDVQGLARLLQLPALTRALQAATRSVPEPTIHQDMAALFSAAQESKTGDVVLQFADRSVFCHSAVLRGRTQYFADFLGEEEWTRKRWNNGQLTMNLKHMKWHIMSFVMRALYSGENANMFSVLDFAQSSEDVLEFMFEIIHAATELHFDRLVLVASTVILRLLTINNASYILSEATHYSAHELVKSVNEYIAVNMETLLESHILDPLHPTTLKQLSRFVRTMQTAKMPTTRIGILEQQALAKHATWVAQEDFPVHILPSNKEIKRRASAKMSPTEGFGTPSSVNTSPTRPRVLATTSTVSSPAPEKESQDDIFAMDEEPPVNTTELGLRSQASLDRMAPWKPSMKPRVDMRSVMAETAAASTKPVIQSTPPRTPALRSSSASGSSSSPWRTQTANTPPASTGVHFPTLSASPKTPTKTPGPAAQNVTKVARPPSGPLSIPSGAGRPDMGPVFVPTRQVPQSSGSKGPQTPSRRSVSGTTSNKAWMRPQVDPVTPPPPSGIAMSFAEIQLSQEFRPVEQEKRSLLEIQEEERARLVEQDFMKWWEEEEERVRLEQQREEQAIEASLRETKSGKNKGGGRVRQKRAAHKGGPPVEGASNGAGKKKKKQPAKAN